MLGSLWQSRSQWHPASLGTVAWQTAWFEPLRSTACHRALTRNTPGSLNKAGSSIPIDVLPRDALMYSPHCRADARLSPYAKRTPEAFTFTLMSLPLVSSSLLTASTCTPRAWNSGASRSSSSQVFGADGAMQAPVKHHQVKTFTGCTPQHKPTTADKRHVERAAILILTFAWGTEPKLG